MVEPYLFTPIFYGVVVFVLYSIAVLEQVPYRSSGQWLQFELSRYVSVLGIGTGLVGIVSLVYPARAIVVVFGGCVFVLTQVLIEEIRADLTADRYYPVEWWLLGLRGSFYTGVTVALTGNLFAGILCLYVAIITTCLHYLEFSIPDVTTTTTIESHYTPTQSNLPSGTTESTITPEIQSLNQSVSENNDPLIDDLQQDFDEYISEITKQTAVDTSELDRFEQLITDPDEQELVELKWILLELYSKYSIPNRVEESQNTLIETLNVVINNWETIWTVDSDVEENTNS
jgi:hypothetical protein